MEKISKEEYLIKCKELLDYFSVDYSKDVIYQTSGGNSCIMNSKSQYYALFGGHSINAVAEYVAKETGKKIMWEKDDCY